MANAVPAIPAWAEVRFNGSLSRARASRSVTDWRSKRTTPVDLLVGNYLSNYFQDLAEAIRTGSRRFKSPRRTDGLRFYERCLPRAIPLSPWPAWLPRAQPRGRWDWFVFDNETDAFWRSMRPLVGAVLDRSFSRCGIVATVSAPVIHFRCASAPLNRHSQYHFQRYSFYRAAARRYMRRTGEPLKRVHLLTCVADEFALPSQAETCRAHLAELLRQLRGDMGLEVVVSNCAHSMFEDFSLMCARPHSPRGRSSPRPAAAAAAYPLSAPDPDVRGRRGRYHAPFLISTGSTMSLLPGLVGRPAGGAFVAPLLFDEESEAANSRCPHRRSGCVGCDWMLRRDHALCQCEVTPTPRPPLATSASSLRARPAARRPQPLQVADYSNAPAVTALLRQPPPPRAASGGGVCSRCSSVHCASFRPGACLIGPPTPSAPSAGGRVLPMARGVGCDAAGGRPMTPSECKASASRSGMGRRWLGSSSSADEPPGCIMWADGNVEYNRAAASGAQRCNARGTCLCAKGGVEGGVGAAELQVVGVAASRSASGPK